MLGLELLEIPQIKRIVCVNYMANDDISRKKLYADGLKNITQSDWINAAEKLNLFILRSKSGTSHYVTLRDPNKIGNDGLKVMITTVLPHLYKEANQSIFKSILEYGKSNNISEDDIWKALGFKYL